MRWISTQILLFLLILLAGCSFEGEHSSPNKKGLEGSAVFVDALPIKVTAPSDNPITPEKVELGRLLFYDPILSGEKDVACATCHHPSNGYAEFRDISIGVNGIGFGLKRKFNQPNDIPFVKRNSQTILNTAFNGLIEEKLYDPNNAPMFWDKRIKSLELQALEPIKAFEEMRGHGFEEEEILTEIINRWSCIESVDLVFL